MGDLQLSELRAEVQASHAGRTDISDARFNTAINLAQRRIARIRDWSDLYWEYEITIPFTGAARDDRFVSIDNQVHKIYSFTIIDLATNETEIVSRITSSEMSDLVERRGLNNVNRPRFYSIVGNSPDNSGAGKKFLELWKPPDQQYSGLLRVYRYPTKLVNDTDISDYHSLDDAIIALANSWIFATLREMDSANAWFRIFKNEIDSAAVDDSVPGRMVLSGDRSVRALPEYWLDPFVKSMSDIS